MINNSKNVIDNIEALRGAMTDDLDDQVSRTRGDTHEVIVGDCVRVKNKNTSRLDWNLTST